MFYYEVEELDNKITCDMRFIFIVAVSEVKERAEK